MMHGAFRTAAVVGAGALMACATPAAALDAGQCLPIDQFNAAMRAEGQRTLVIGNRVAVNDTATRTEATRTLYAISSNDDGSSGYEFIGNRPRTEPSTEVCIGTRLTNVRIYDARRNTIAPEAYLGGRFNLVVDNHAARGIRPMIVADTVFGSGEAQRLGRPVVMFGNPDDRSGNLSTLLANGDPAMLVFTMETDYTPNALQRLGAQRAEP